MKEFTLTKALDISNGIQQTKFIIDYIYVYEDRVEIHTKQGNTIPVPMNSYIQAFLDTVGTASKVVLETPKAVEVAPMKEAVVETPIETKPPSK